MKPSVTKFTEFIKSSEKFMPNIKNAQHVGSSFCIKTVLSNVDKTDERPTIIEKINEDTIIVFSGKIPSCIKTARQIKESLN